MVTSTNPKSHPVSGPTSDTMTSNNNAAGAAVNSNNNTAVASLQNIVPACPQGLCINKNDFLKPDFTVDNFFLEVSVREGGTSLDTLRDDLGIYLKVLRSSMIELINQDYADFVNLSTNLVGLDQGIIRIREPLDSFNEEIVTAKVELETCLKSIRTKLARQERIRQEKEMLSSLQRVAAITVKVERMVGAELTTDTAERIAADINQLNFALWKMKESKFIQKLEPRVTRVCDALNTWLDVTCLEAIRTGNSSQLSRCLRIYATIDRVAAAEKLVREEIVQPEVESCMMDSEAVTSSNLGVVCEALLRIIAQHLAPLIRLTTDDKKIVDGSVTGFDFLAHSYWPEVVHNYVEQLGHVASPGNPEEFFRNYNISMKFLEGFEANIVSSDSFDRIRDSESYTSFLSMWNLAVYFQIRFQEIAKPVETLMTETVIEKAEGSECRLKVTDLVKSSIQSCFKQGIFLAAVSDKFLQLSLQIVSRYKVWAEYCLKTFQSGPTSDMKRSDTAKNLQTLETTSSKKTIAKSASEKDLASVSSQNAPAVLTVDMTDIVAIFSDISHLMSALPSLIVLPSPSSVDISPAVSGSVSQLSSVLPLLSSAISTHISSGPIKNVKSVVDIPRMYRRTNRETPSKPCPYIVTLVDSLASVQAKYQSQVDSGALTSWLGEACTMVCGQYLVQVQDVLSNVTKLEESLMKLKKARDRGGAGLGEKGDKSGGLSDDDKIRLQLYLDVSFFLREVGSGKLGDLANVLQGESFIKIKSVVDEAVSSFMNQLQL